MVLQNTRQTVTSINNLVVDNNPISAIACIKSSGITINDTSRGLLVFTLENLFNTNKSAWVSVIKCIQYDPNVNNYTTSPVLKQNLIDTYNQQYNIPASESSKINLGAIFSAIGDYIGGTSTTGGGGEQTETTPALSSGVIIAIVAAVVIVIALIVFKKSN